MPIPNDEEGDLRVYWNCNPDQHERNWPVKSIEDGIAMIRAWELIEPWARPPGAPHWYTGIQIFDGTSWDLWEGTDEQHWLLK